MTKHGWVVQRGLAWLLGFRRLGVRYVLHVDLLQGVLHLVCSLICIRFLSTAPS